MKTVDIEIYRKRDLYIVVSLTIKVGEAGKPQYSTFNNTEYNGKRKLTFRPSTAVIIKSRNSFDGNVFIPISEFEDLLSALKKFKKSFNIDDLYLLDTKNRLMLNRKISDKYKYYCNHFGKYLSIQHTIIVIDNVEHEGVQISVNDAYHLLTYKEVKNMYKTLKRIDVTNLGLSMAILNEVKKDEPIKVAVDNPEFNTGDYFRKNESPDSTDMLKRSKNGGKGKWH